MTSDQSVPWIYRNIRRPRWHYTAVLVVLAAANILLHYSPQLTHLINHKWNKSSGGKNSVDAAKQEPKVDKERQGLIDCIDSLTLENENLAKEKKELEDKLESTGVAPDKDSCDIGVAFKLRYFFNIIPGRTHYVSMDKIVEELGNKYGKIAFNQLQLYGPDSTTYTFTPKDGGTLKIFNYKGEEVASSEKYGVVKFNPKWIKPDKGSKKAGRAPFYPIDGDSGRTPNQYRVEYTGANGDKDNLVFEVVRTSRELEVGIISSLISSYAASKFFPNERIKIIETGSGGGPTGDGGGGG